MCAQTLMHMLMSMLTLTPSIIVFLCSFEVKKIFHTSSSTWHASVIAIIFEYMKLSYKKASYTFLHGTWNSGYMKLSCKKLHVSSSSLHRINKYTIWYVYITSVHIEDNLRRILGSWILSVSLDFDAIFLVIPVITHCNSIQKSMCMIINTKFIVISWTRYTYINGLKHLWFQWIHDATM